MIALAVFTKTKQERFTLVPPVYHLALYVVFFIFGIATASLANKEALFLGASVFGLLSSLAELGFASYLMKRFQFI
jgi:hypothetical protein